MNEESEQIEVTQPVENTQEIEGENTGIVEGESTANAETNEVQEESGETEGQGRVQSKSRNAKARLRRKLETSEANNAKLVEDNQQLHKKFDSLTTKVDAVLNPPPARPDRVNFDTEEQYEDSLFNWRDEQKAVVPTENPDTQVQSVDKPVAQQAPNEQQQEVIDNWNDSVEDAADKYDDFEEVVLKNESLAISPIMRDAIMESGVGTEVAYHLGKNMKLAREISTLSLVGQINKINELSKKFTKTSTNAPEPVNTVEKGQASTGKRVHPSLVGATFE